MSNTITESNYKKLSWSRKQEYVKELACQCNSCHNKWHYLDSVEKQIKHEQTSNALMGIGMCCNPCMTTATSNANTQLAQQEAKLKSCPKCGSSNVTRNAKFFKK